MTVHPTLAAVTDRIRARSQHRREAYLKRVQSAYQSGVTRHRINCTNIAHAYAAMPVCDKTLFKADLAPNVGIVTAYNDMLSAHQPYGTYPELIKDEVRQVGATAQVAGGVPAMCDRKVPSLLSDCASRRAWHGTLHVFPRCHCPVHCGCPVA